MTNYELEEFKAWLEEERNQETKEELSMTSEITIEDWEEVRDYIWAKTTPSSNLTERAIWRWMREVDQWNQKITRLKTQHERELSIIRADLNTSQNNLTQKTNELTQAQEFNTKLQQDNRDLLNDIHQYKQKITTLESQNKTQAETLKNTQKELTEANQKHQNHLSQEKAQLTKEIQLIKEVIN